MGAWSCQAHPLCKQWYPWVRGWQGTGGRAAAGCVPLLTLQCSSDAEHIDSTLWLRPLNKGHVARLALLVCECAPGRSGPGIWVRVSCCALCCDRSPWPSWLMMRVSGIQLFKNLWRLSRAKMGAKGMLFP